MRTYADTSFLYALIDDGDPGHERAAAAYREYRGDIMLSSYVFAETISLITKRFGKSWAIAVGESIRNSKRTAVLQPTAGEFEAAWDLFRERHDSGFDLVDALSFQMMLAHGLASALSLDGHFAQMGFSVQPGAQE